jgi:hypothetical protein
VPLHTAPLSELHAQPPLEFPRIVPAGLGGAGAPALDGVEPG